MPHPYRCSDPRVSRRRSSYCASASGAPAGSVAGSPMPWCSAKNGSSSWRCRAEHLPFPDPGSRGRSRAGAACRGSSAAASPPTRCARRPRPAGRPPTGRSRCRRGCPRPACGRPPGRSSSIGKLITSVGPSRFIHRSCSVAIGSGSTNMIVRSDCVLTLIWSSTHTPRSEKTFGSMTHCVSLITSTLIIALSLPCPTPDGVGVPIVRLHDPPDQRVPHHVGRIQMDERDVRRCRRGSARWRPVRSSVRSGRSG